MIRAPRCSCGGTLHAAKVDSVEIAPLFGLRGTIVGPVPGLRCDSCKAETFEASTIEMMLMVVAREVLVQAQILTPDEARFLRKAVLGITQDVLGKRMGINKITVADWERGERPLSKEHDYELRGISLASLLNRAPRATGRAAAALARQVARILSAPRLLGPSKRTKRYVIPASEAA